MNIYCLNMSLPSKFTLTLVMIHLWFLFSQVATSFFSSSLLVLRFLVFSFGAGSVQFSMAFFTLQQWPACERVSTAWQNDQRSAGRHCWNQVIDYKRCGEIKMFFRGMSLRCASEGMEGFKVVGPCRTEAFEMKRMNQAARWFDTLNGLEEMTVHAYLSIYLALSLSL